MSISFDNNKVKLTGKVFDIKCPDELCGNILGKIDDSGSMISMTSITAIDIENQKVMLRCGKCKNFSTYEKGNSLSMSMIL